MARLLKNPLDEKDRQDAHEDEDIELTDQEVDQAGEYGWWNPYAVYDPE